MKWIWVVCLFSFGILYSVQAQDTVRIIRLKNQPIIEGTINGKKAYFLVDTGSDITMLHENDAKKYDFSYRERSLKGYEITGFGSNRKGRILEANNVTIFLGATRVHARCRVFDLENIVASISGNTGIRVNAIIGSDMMIQYRFVINYYAREVVILNDN